MSNISKDSTEKPDKELAARDSQIADLRADVGILKQHINNRATAEAKAASNKRKLSNTVQGLGRLSGLQNTLGTQSINTKTK
jgi:hypothetical protein